MVHEDSNRGDSRAGSQEGVRIIGPDEAKAALEAGQAAGRRPGETLGFGDVPPVPSGPRPQHRFPLPESVDPAAVASPAPAAPPTPQRPPAPRASRSVTPDEAHDPRPWDARTPVASAGDDAAGEPAGGLPPPDDVPPLPPPRSMWDDPAARPWVTSPPPPTPRSPAPPEPVVPGSDPAPEQSESGEGAPAEDPGPPVGNEVVAGSEPAEDDHSADSSDRPPLPAEEAITMSGGSGPEMPHWTDPPTGEVPRSLAGGEPEEDEDLAAWRALGSRGVRWREEGDDWEEVPFEEFGDEETRVGALDTSRADHSDLFSFDEDFSRLEEERSGGHAVVDDEEEDYGDAASGPDPEVVGVGSSRRQAAPIRTRLRGGGGPPFRDASRELATRLVVGAGLLALLFIAWAVGPKALVVYAAAIVVAASAEAYGMLQRSGFRPATLLALVVTAGTMFGAYWKGIEALPLGCVLLFAGSMLWYLLGIVEARPLANVAVTTMTYLWVGLLGSFAALMLRQPHGAGLFVGPVLCAVAADVAAFAVGGRVGSRMLAPSVSPSKTVEGVLAGLVAAIVIGAIIGKELTPWGGVRHGLVLGLVVGIVAPVGDLFESMVKRDLNIKDSGTVLPGHGGLLDRFDSILLILPAAYYLAFWFHL